MYTQELYQSEEESEETETTEEQIDVNQILTTKNGTIGEDVTCESSDDDSIGLVRINNIFISKAVTQEPSTQKCNCTLGEQCLRVIADSGASNHITGDRTVLEDLKRCPKISVVGALSTVSYAKYSGTLRINTNEHTEMDLSKVLLCKEINGTIISIAQLTRQGYRFVTDKKGMQFFDPQGVHICTATPLNGNFILHCKKTPKPKEAANLKMCQTKVSPTFTEADIIHARFGHCHSRYLKQAGLVTGKLHFCIGCHEGKIVRSPTRRTIDKSSTICFVPKKNMEKLHLDIIGPFRQSVDRKKFALTIVDEFSGYGFVFTLKHKGQSANYIRKLIEQLHTTYQTAVRCIKTDSGGEFISNELTNYLELKGILHEFSSPHQPSENGRIERYNRVLKDCMRALLTSGAIPKHFWTFALKYSCDIWNVIPRKHSNFSPYEKFLERKPPYNRYFIFGSKGFARTHRKAQFRRGVPIIFLGFAKNMKGYVVYDQETRMIKQVRDIHLDELEH